MTISNINYKLILHIILGLIAAQSSVVVLLWAMFILFYEGVYKVFTKPSVNQVIGAVSYMAAMEMLVRMSRAGLPHEYTKYAIPLVLLTGTMQLRKRGSKGWPFVWYLFLLLPSIIMLSEVYEFNALRQYVSFNLSGPLCLAAAGWFFYRRPVSQEELLYSFRQFLLPMVATIAYLFIKTPSLTEIEFSYGANSAASGYGPNQMSSLLGFGILLIGLCLLLGWRLFSSVWISYGLLVLLAFRALLTFSRGGLLGPLLVLVILVLYFGFTSSRFRRRLSPQLTAFVVLFVLGYGLFQYVNSQTSGALFNRYAGIKDGERIGLDKYTSGRTNILEIDGEIFKDNPVLGIGPGAGADIRVDYGYGQRVAAHIELSRLPAEHGAFGIVSLLILLFFPLMEFLKRHSFDQRVLLFVGTAYCISFMLHSATRIALPMLLYGMGFMYLINAQPVPLRSKAILRR